MRLLSVLEEAHRVRQEMTTTVPCRPFVCLGRVPCCSCGNLRFATLGIVPWTTHGKSCVGGRRGSRVWVGQEIV